MRRAVLVLLALLAPLACASRATSPTATPAAPSVAAFRFDAARVPVGRVVHYVKSNLDGSKPALVSVYFAAADRIEVYKSEQGLDDAAEVNAWLDWSTFSIARLEAGVIRADGSREARARVEVEADGRLHVRVGDQEQRIAGPAAPFHVYNFDLMSLGAALPHLAAPAAPFAVTIVDPTFGRSPGLVEDRGAVAFTFVGEEALGGVPCRKYALTGPGLLDRGGALWTRASDGLIERVESPLANNPDWQSFRLERVGEAPMTAEAWETYRRTHVGAGVPPELTRP